MAGWHQIIIQAFVDVLSDDYGVEAIRSVEDTTGFQKFIDETYDLGLAPSPPPTPQPTPNVPYGRQTTETDRATLLAVRDHFLANGSNPEEFKSWDLGDEGSVCL